MSEGKPAEDVCEHCCGPRLYITGNGLLGEALGEAIATNAGFRHTSGCVMFNPPHVRDGMMKSTADADRTEQSLAVGEVTSNIRYIPEIVGWQCPMCSVIHAPFIRQCHCRNVPVAPS